jgi:hypothetical protein
MKAREIFYHPVCLCFSSHLSIVKINEVQWRQLRALIPTGLIFSLLSKLVFWIFHYYKVTFSITELYIQIEIEIIYRHAYLLVSSIRKLRKKSWVQWTLTMEGFVHCWAKRFEFSGIYSVYNVLTIENFPNIKILGLFHFIFEIFRKIFVLKMDGWNILFLIQLDELYPTIKKKHSAEI